MGKNRLFKKKTIRKNSSNEKQTLKKNEKIFQEQKDSKGMPQAEWQKKQTITQNRGRKRQNLCNK